MTEKTILTSLVEGEILLTDVEHFKKLGYAVIYASHTHLVCETEIRYRSLRSAYGKWPSFPDKEAVMCDYPSDVLEGNREFKNPLRRMTDLASGTDIGGHGLPYHLRVLHEYERDKADPEVLKLVDAPTQLAIRVMSRHLAELRSNAEFEPNLAPPGPHTPF